MKQAKPIVVAVFAVAMTLVTGCVGTLSMMPKQEELSRLKGMTTEAVFQKWGKPYRKSVTSEGEVWVYAEPSPSKAGINGMAKWSTFGMSDPAYIDTVTITFRNNKVTRFAQEDEVVNLKLPGL